MENQTETKNIENWKNTIYGNDIWLIDGKSVDGAVNERNKFLRALLEIETIVNSKLLPDIKLTDISKICEGIIPS